MLNVFLLRVAEHLLSPPGADAVGFSEWTMPRGFVILAGSEAEARTLAARSDGGGPWWDDQNSTRCELIPIEGAARIVMADEPTG